MRLNDLKPAGGSRHRRKRVGCGESSGHGKTSGRGNKGHKARSGGSNRPGFEGGQMPLIRRLPKRGFNNARFKREVQTFNLDQLDAFADGETVSRATLQERGMVGARAREIKILGRGELDRKLRFEVDAVSASAREKIERAGGSVASPAAAGGAR